MAIQIEAPDGTIKEFPDDMSQKDIQRVMMEKFPPTVKRPNAPMTEATTPETVASNLASGFGSGLKSFGQGLINAPGALTEPIRSIGSQFAERARARGEAERQGGYDAMDAMNNEADQVTPTNSVSRMLGQKGGEATGTAATALASAGLAKSAPTLVSRFPSAAEAAYNVALKKVPIGGPMAEAAINALRGKTEPQPLSSFKTSPTLSRPSETPQLTERSLVNRLPLPTANTPEVPQPISLVKRSPMLTRPELAAEPQSEVQPLSSFKTSPMLARPKPRATGQLATRSATTDNPLPAPITATKTQPPLPSSATIRGENELSVPNTKVPLLDPNSPMMQRAMKDPKLAKIMLDLGSMQ